MLIKKLITTLLFSYSVIATSSFIGDSERAELFEMTDNEIPTIRITIPEDEYEELKEIANRGYCVYLPNGVIYPLNHIDDSAKIDWTPIFTAPPGYNAFEQTPFETKNAKMTFEINGTTEEYNKITFKLGGSSSRMFGKQGYNIKIRGKKDIHGRTQIKLRSDAREATYLRTKIASDIHHRLGLQTISANYATLYINDEYMGLYILMDSIKKSWIEYVYGDADTTGLYECGKAGTDLSLSTSYGCINENEDVEDDSELIELLTALDNANSAEDIEDIFDVDSFLTEIAYEYLVGSWDHFLVYGHNFYLYKQQNGKWLYFITDFDGDIGQDISMGMAGVTNKKNLYKPDEADFENFTFEEWTTTQIHLIDILIKNDSTRFDTILKTLVKEVFNPATLYPHIDELKEFIRPYVIADKELNEDGKYPGKLHEEAGDYSLAEWEANCEFTTVGSMQKSLGYGLKYWILARYRTVCANYDMQCDPVYIDDNYEYSIDEDVQATVDDDLRLNHSDDPPKPIETNDDEPPQPTQTSNAEPSEPIQSVVESPKPTESVIEPPKPTQTISPFIGDTERAELFEMTDNEIPIIRVTLPEDEYKELIDIASKGYRIYFPDGSEYFLSDSTGGESIDWSPMASAPPGYDPFQQLPFETKNGAMTFEVNGTTEEYKKITFKLGGSSSRVFGKQGYNIKIRGKQDLHGRTQIKLRPDTREATYLRTKLASDIHQRLGLPAISANYAMLYVNDEYMGLYILMDSIKKSWIEYVYGDADTTGLYECGSTGNTLSVDTSVARCVNENEDVEDNSELVEFLTALDNANSAEDIEDIFDVDLFLTEIAYEYLAGSWDHFLIFGHNFYLYKQSNGKWLYLITDFDGDIGQDISMGLKGVRGQKEAIRFKPSEANFEDYTFDEWARFPKHIIDILIKNDSTRFDNILKNIVDEVFNPATLFPHIDELKEFIRPYVIIDKTLGENGKYPGKHHVEAGDYSLEEWEANCEFTTIKSLQKSLGYGLKYWILSRYRSVCTNYDMECDPVYMNENYEYTIDKNVEGTLEDDEMLDWSSQPSQPTQTSNVEPSEPTQNAVEPPPTVTEEPAEPTEVVPPDEPPEITTTITTTPTPTPTVHYKCMAESIGYPCCSRLNKIVVRHDKYGDWGYDILRRTHCGISPYVPPTPPEPPKSKCWTEKYGHPCCDDCKAFRVGLLGLWGYDFKNKKWCGLSYSCR